MTNSRTLPPHTLAALHSASYLAETAARYEAEAEGFRTLAREATEREDAQDYRFEANASARAAIAYRHALSLK